MALWSITEADQMLPPCVTVHFAVGYASLEQIPSGAEEPGPKSPPGKELEVAHSACSLADWGEECL